MRTCISMIALSLASSLALGVAGAAPAAAQAHAAAPAPVDAVFEPLFEAADQGDIGPLERALSNARDPELATLIRARLAAARFDDSVIRDPALATIAGSSTSATRRAAALGIIAGAAFSSGDYAVAATSAGALADLFRAGGRAEEAAGAQRTADLSRLLAPHGSQRVERRADGSLPATTDAVGLTRIRASASGQEQEMVVDTGANLSVLSASAAARLGVRVEQTSTDIGNGVEGIVAVRVGVVDRLDVAGTIVRNVAFLVIDDAQLTFPVAGGYRIDAILGLPVLRALGRIRIERAGRFIVGPSSGSTARANMSASGNDLFARIRIGTHDVALLLDTGASQTNLSSRFAAVNPDVLQGLERQATNMASAGGARQVQSAVLRDQPVVLAGGNVTMPAIRVTLPGATTAAPARNLGTLGLDVLRRFESFTLDFRAMRLEVGPVVAAPSAPAS